MLPTPTLRRSAPSHATQAARWTLGGLIGGLIGALIALALNTSAPQSDLYEPLAHFALIGASVGAVAGWREGRWWGALARALAGGLLGLLTIVSAFTLCEHFRAFPGLATAALTFGAAGVAVGLVQSGALRAHTPTLRPNTRRLISAFAHGATVAVGLLCAVALFFDVDSPSWLASPYLRDAGSGALLGFFAALGAPLTQLVAHPFTAANAATSNIDDASLVGLAPDDVANVHALHGAHQRALARLRQAHAQGALSNHDHRTLREDLDAHVHASRTLTAAIAQLTACAHQHPARHLDAQHQRLTRLLTASQDPIARAEYRASLQGLQRQRATIAHVTRDRARLSARLHRARLAVERLELQLSLRIAAPAQDLAHSVALTHAPAVAAHTALAPVRRAA